MIMSWVNKIIIKKAYIFIILCIWLLPLKGHTQQTYDMEVPPRIMEFLGDQPMTRVGRPFVVLASISNPAKDTVNFLIRLRTPGSIRIDSPSKRSIRLAPNEKVTIRWKIVADKPLYEELQLEVIQGKAVLAAAKLPVRFLPAMQQTKLAYIPKPHPINKNEKLLVGAHYFPGWENDRPEMWNQLMKHPERTPALGFYDQGNPEVADWETKWAVEHGIDFFIYCWYRTSQGGPVEQQLGSAIEARNKSKFQNQMKFTIMWENQNKGKAG